MQFVLRGAQRTRHYRGKKLQVRLLGEHWLTFVLKNGQGFVMLFSILYASGNVHLKFFAAVTPHVPVITFIYVCGTFIYVCGAKIPTRSVFHKILKNRSVFFTFTPQILIVRIRTAHDYLAKFQCGSFYAIKCIDSLSKTISF